MSISFAHPVTLSKPQFVAGAARAAPHLSIRRKILLAFLCVGLVTAGVGAYAIRSMVGLGSLTDQAIDGALSSIGYARSASAGFIALEAAVVRYRALPNQIELLPRVDDLSRTLDENLAAVIQHAPTPQAAQLAADAGAALADWRAAGGSAAAGPADASRVDALARVANRRLERLIDHAARDGLEFQQRARAQVAEAGFQTLLLIIAAMILSTMIATLLAQRIMGLIAKVSAAACRIAAGHADAELPNVGADELGTLLTTVATMRANIVAMTALELAGRQRAQPTSAEPAKKANEGVSARKQASIANTSSV